MLTDIANLLTCFAIYADLFCTYQEGWKPQPHPGTQVARPGCFLPDLTN